MPNLLPRSLLSIEPMVSGMLVLIYITPAIFYCLFIYLLTY